MERASTQAVLTKCIKEFIDAYRRDLVANPREGGIDRFWKELFLEVYFVDGVRCRYASGDEMGDLMVKIACHYGSFKALEKACAARMAKLISCDCEGDIIEKIIVCDRNDPVFLRGCFYNSECPATGRVGL